MQPDSSAATEGLGRLLLKAASATASQAWLVAPFAKSAVVERLLDRLPTSADVTLVTRWRPEEVANGVSDLEVWDLIKSRPGARMLLESTLHAKYFRFDNRAFVGSANLTAAALGWRNPSNFELLVCVDPLPKFEGSLLHRSFEPTRSLRDAIAEAALALRPEPTFVVDEEHDDSAVQEFEVASRWLPQMRHPEDLYVAYGGDIGSLGRASREAARRDLAALELPRGLSQDAFESVVGARLLSVKVVGQIDAFVQEVRRFGEVRDWLTDELGLHRDDATIAWQTLMRWLLHFLPGRYVTTRPRHSEGLQRVLE